MSAKKNPPTGVAASGGGIEVRAVDPGDIMRIVCHGFLTSEQVDDAFVKLAPHFARRRAHGHMVRLLIDNRTLSVQGSETADTIRQGVQSAHRIGDRIAILVASSLGALQARRILDGFAPQSFQSEAEALEWLQADD